jgi:hypothetical protein
MRQYAAKPLSRFLRVYAVDPSVSMPLDGPIEQYLTLKVPWEEPLQQGPIGEYVEIIDYDPASRSFFAPVDLNFPWVLANAGLPPAEGVPQFHQQMVYALAMTTIRHFETALGRMILWAPRALVSGEQKFVQRLRIYPHALPEANAYYSPSKKALLFGYFRTEISTKVNPIPATAFTCLSHNIVAHETTHAILDGLRRAVTLDNGGPEAVVFQQAFADSVGLLQHFALPGFLRSQVAFTGDLEKNESLLEDLARRLANPAPLFGELRRSIGRPAAAKETASESVSLSGRASVLVAAIFDTFLKVFRKRTADLLRLTGLEVAASRELNRDLLDAISAQAAKSASHVLQMCIRAIDYCPPVDVTVVDYLRAIVTADTELMPEDERGYRAAVLGAFRQRGISPGAGALLGPFGQEMQLEFGPSLEMDLRAAWDRRDQHQQEQRRCAELQSHWLEASGGTLPVQAAREMGLATGMDAPHTIERTARRLPALAVDSFCLARRHGSPGKQLDEWVITISQRRRGYFDLETQKSQDDGAKLEEPDFIFYGGCTLLVDPVTRRVRSCIAKDILSGERLASYRQSLLERPPAPAASDYTRKTRASEPFSLLRTA